MFPLASIVRFYSPRPWFFAFAALMMSVGLALLTVDNLNVSNAEGIVCLVILVLIVFVFFWDCRLCRGVCFAFPRRNVSPRCTLSGDVRDVHHMRHVLRHVLVSVSRSCGASIARRIVKRVVPMHLCVGLYQRLHHHRLGSRSSLV